MATAKKAATSKNADEHGDDAAAGSAKKAGASKTINGPGGKIKTSKDFDAKFLETQQALLIAERGCAHRSGQPTRGRGQLIDRGRRDG